MCAFEIVLTKLPFPEAGLVSFSQQRVNAASSTFLQELSFVTLVIFFHLTSKAFVSSCAFLLLSYF